MDALPPLALPTPTLLSGLDPAMLAAQSKPGDPKTNEAAAQGFESMFASLLVKQMRQGLGSGTLFPQDSGDVLGGMFDLYLGQYFAQQGALGIGKMVKQQLAQKTKA